MQTIVAQLIGLLMIAFLTYLTNILNSDQLDGFRIGVATTIIYEFIGCYCYWKTKRHVST